APYIILTTVPIPAPPSDPTLQRGLKYHRPLNSFSIIPLNLALHIILLHTLTITNTSTPRQH
ncbi:hypothetical protein EX30DRAFT_331358, partial [Ascodesmis nigricans]